MPDNRTRLDVRGIVEVIQIITALLWTEHTEATLFASNCTFWFFTKDGFLLLDDADYEFLRWRTLRIQKKATRLVSVADIGERKQTEGSFPENLQNENKIDLRIIQGHGS